MKATEESTLKCAVCHSHELLKKKKIEDVLLLPEKENKIFKVSKCEGNCVKGLVTNTEPFRLREIQINFFKCSYKVDASFKTYI